MSRGLGKLQREILETLDDAKRHFGEDYSYHGGFTKFGIAARWKLPGWVVHRGAAFRLGEAMYDLRASCRYLAHRHDALDRGRWLDPRFQASFSRAVRSLVKRGLLVPKHLLRIEDYDEETAHHAQIQHLKEGMYVFVSERQVRFVGKRYGPTHNA
jgi:hypothetical protein